MYKKVLILGSGPIRIGQAAEFDYSGSQACRALKEEGCEVILLNSNPATIQTDVELADYVYIKPLTVETVEQILQVHSPDGVIATLGGQTGLNLCVECEERGIWQKYGTKVLGTSVTSIREAEGRQAFRELMIKTEQPIIESVYVSSIDEGVVFAEETSFPLIIRPDYTLGGTGGGVAYTMKELSERLEEGLRASPVHRVLLERYLEGWHEIEAEVIRDEAGNKICVCGMENIDPMGVHTGDSVVVSPVLTLTDDQWLRLKKAALDIVESLEVEGACNVQFALSPDGEEYAVIEVNPRASRSSALASKATGYPIARIAAKIALGKTLPEIPNPMTGNGNAMVEPDLDYIVLKLPRWPFDAFPTANMELGTKMKATGEVVAVGKTLPQALLKAFRSIDGRDQLFGDDLKELANEDLWDHVTTPTSQRIPAMFDLLRKGFSVSEIAQRSAFVPYFIEIMSHIVAMEKKLRDEGLSILAEAKKLGFSDRVIAALTKHSIKEIREEENRQKINMIYREIDGCATDEPAESGYYFGYYDQAEVQHKEASERTIAVLGSGAIRIAQGVEFDYCCVKAVEALRRRGIRAVMINNNPETVSTDYDISDALYLEPLTEEDVDHILSQEGAEGILASYGGQTSLRLGQILASQGAPIIGTSFNSINMAEDRGAFAKLLRQLKIHYPEGDAVTSLEEGIALIEKLGFPLMVRPSFVIGGVAMHVATRFEDCVKILEMAFSAEPDQSVMIDRFLPGKEFEVDAVCDGKDILIPGIFEHLDPAGIHSGDSISIFPDISLNQRQRQEIVDITRKLSEALDVHGLLNIQFVLSSGTLYVIEANPRASRTVPIGSKLTGIPLVDLSVGVALGERLVNSSWGTGLYPYTGPFGVKAPVFSTEKLPGIDSRLGPQMQSTGESLGVADTVSDALFDALQGADLSIPEKGRVLFSVRDDVKDRVYPVASMLSALGWDIDATPGTATLLKRWGLPVNPIKKDDSLFEGVRNGRWQLIVNIPGLFIEPLTDGAKIRKAALDGSIVCLHSLETAAAVASAAIARKK